MKCALCKINNVDKIAHIITNQKLKWKTPVWRYEKNQYGESLIPKFSGYKNKTLGIGKYVCQDCYEVYLKKQNGLNYIIIDPCSCHCDECEKENHAGCLKQGCMLYINAKNDNIGMTSPERLHQLIVN
jgi:hypothetical protein